MKVAIVGSRDYPHLDRVRSYVAKLPPGTTVISGGAKGVDHEAEQAAIAAGLHVASYPAAWQTYGNAAGPIRNMKIVQEADIIVAFWNGSSRGTLDTITKAVKSDKKVIIYGVQYVGEIKT